MCIVYAEYQTNTDVAIFHTAVSDYELQGCFSLVYTFLVSDRCDKCH